MDTRDYGSMLSESPWLDLLATTIREEESSDHDVLAVAVATLVYSALTARRLGEEMTPEQIGACAALVLVDKAGFHRLSPGACLYPSAD